MADRLLSLDLSLRAEAEELLERRGLLALLAGYGKPHVIGSCALELMAWRDLDISLDAADVSEAAWFELGGRLNELLHPAKMYFSNCRTAPREGLPRGLYWGVHLGDARKGAWKIDIWSMDEAACKEAVARCEELQERITPQARLAIIAIKSQCWQDPQYRRAYTSGDIYRAVLGEGVTGIKQFRAYLHRIGIKEGAQ